MASRTSRKERRARKAARKAAHTHKTAARIRPAHRAKPGQPAMVVARQVGSTYVITIPKPLRRVFQVKIGDKVRLDASKHQLLATLA